MDCAQFKMASNNNESATRIAEGDSIAESSDEEVSIMAIYACVSILRHRVWIALPSLVPIPLHHGEPMTLPHDRRGD